MATYDATNYDNSPIKLRSGAEQPTWFSFTYKVPTTLTLATGDIIRLAKAGSGQQIIAAQVGCTGSIAAGSGTSVIKTGSTTVASLGDFGGADGNAGIWSAGAHVTAADADITLTLGTLTTATTSGARSINVRLLVAQQESRAQSGNVTIEWPAHPTS